MKPIIYEIKRTLTSKFVIVLIVAIVGLSTLIAYESAKGLADSSSSSVPSSVSLIPGYYIQGNNITVVTIPVNPYGQPDSSHLSSGVSLSYNGTTKVVNTPSGNYYNATFSLANRPDTVLLMNYTYSSFRQTTTASQGFLINNSQPDSGLNTEYFPIDPSNTTTYGVSLFYVGPNGSASPSLTVYFDNLSTSYTNNPSSLNETTLIMDNAISSTSISGIHYTTVFPVFKGNEYKDNLTLSVISSKSIYITGFTKLGSNQSVLKGSLQLLGSSFAPVTEKIVQDLIFSGISTIVGFFIAILSVFEGYLTYGKDRTSGVLESVLKRPVTRGTLISSRFAANAVSIAIAVIVSMISADLLIHYYLHLYLSMSFDLYFIWSFFVEGAAFLALVYFFSHLVKSQGAVLGSSIGLFVVFGLFWSVIADVFIFAFHISSSSSAYVTTQIAFDYASPSGFSALFQILFEKTIGSSFGAGTSINPSLFGVIPAFIVLAGILWIAVPFLGAFTLATRRD